MRIDQNSIREIHSRTDIAGFIGGYVPLRKRGNDLVGLCPFHSERTPSFHVHPDRGFFKCFGCGAGGDVIAFLQKLENLPWQEAVRVLASRAGVVLEPEHPGAVRVRSEREAIYEANQAAAGFFHRMLNAGSEGAAARSYCAQRGLTDATIEKFRLGYAPDRWDALVRELQSTGIDLVIAEKAGLVKAGQRGYYDFYRGRLMIPTYATTGEVIAFGGRALNEAEPKYLNTSTTPVYTKGRYLFALNVARRATAADGSLIVVEGYLDCIALHQAGFGNTVAALGTAFTQEQAMELRRYAENIFICFDSDAAGSVAASKATDIALRTIENSGTKVRIVALPAGEDPDSFVRKSGPDAFAQALRDAKASIEFKLDPQLEKLALGFESPSNIARKAEQLIRDMTPREEWDKWRVYIAGRLKVKVEDLRNSRFFANSANFAPRLSLPVQSRHVPLGLTTVSFERDVLGIVLEEPFLLSEFGQRISPERFENELYRHIYGTILSHAAQLQQSADVFSLFAQEDATIEVLTDLQHRDRSSTLRYAGTDERRAHLERVADRLELQDRKRRYEEIDRRINELSATGVPVPEDLKREYFELVGKLKK
ncbi:MAG: DNA primase [Candidatus Eremiobacteraeota bacterium]|nr:DNA primase [Candidatus Eremiobacteraeota bacterium]